MIYKRSIYQVKKNKIEEVKKAIVEFVEAIKQNEKGTKIYEAYQLDDGLTFIHFMAFKNAESEKKHRNAEYTKKFVIILYPNCLKEPKFNKLRLIYSNI